jgi:methanogenic corrinoid protein MtbC1
MVARLTGLSTHTLRMWERRHGAVEPSRTPGGDRLYTASDVVRLQRLAALVNRGHAVSRVAPLSDEQLEELVGSEAGDTKLAGPTEGEQTALIEEVIEAVFRLDHRRAEQILRRAVVGLEPSVFISDLIEPLLRTIGDRWRTGEIEIYHEHILSNLVRNVLVSLLSTIRVTDANKRLVIATPQGERHEFGALSVSLLVAGLGWSPTYLGTDLPADDIVEAAHRTDAQLVLLSVVHVSPATQRELARIEEALRPSIRLLIGGSGASHLEVTRAELVGPRSLEQCLGT